MSALMSAFDEISAVDRPAQGHARMALMKRDELQERDEMQFETITRDEVADFATFEAAVGHLRKLHGLCASEAMSRAARQFPDLLKRYNEEGLERVAEAGAAAVKARRNLEAVTRWNLLVDGIAEREGVSRSVAMQRARRSSATEGEANHISAANK